MPIVYIGIGSNIGKREINCLRAIDLLDQNGVKVLRRSTMQETEPWGVEDQPKFINMAVEAETEFSPRNLLKVLQKIESLMGRRRETRWGPRLIDLDILFYDDLVLEERDLTIPHPMFHLRRFVLEPLSELAADKLHPVLKKTVRDLLSGVA